MTESIKLLELFSGIQSQERALSRLNIPYESVGVCDCDKDVLVASAAMRFNLEEEITNYDFPDVEIMIKELQDKNIGYDFDKQKHTITSRTPITKLRKYYISDKLLKNLGDISKVDKLPRANLVTYSSPCQSFSVAGKLAGATKTCTKCGYNWDIDFSNPDYNYKCPICGNASLESTTSGLLQEVQRLLSIAYEENELPEYLLLENVKNLVSKKFIEQFEAWIKWLDSIGYNTSWKVLNGKHYGIPQNRERVFAISIRKDIDTKGFIFPETIPLTTRLKDMLEHDVPEKYYLSDDRIEKILNSASIHDKKCQCVPANWITNDNEVFPTITAHYYKEGVNNFIPNTSSRCKVPCVVEENPEPFIVASRGRNPDNPSDRTVGLPTEQRLEPNFSGCTNTLTSVQKDNYVCEPQVLRAERTEYGKAIRKQYEAGEINEKIGNMREMKPRTDGISNTITTLLKDNYVVEPIVCEERKDEGIRLFKDDCVGTLRTIDACGDKRVIEPELMIEDVVFPVMVRKYPVDCSLLCGCLRNHKSLLNLSNKDISDALNVPLTKVEHWFRQDECFAIPDADIWFKLKELLNITTSEFDESIMTFEIKDGIYDKANRCYHVEGIAPTLTVASANEKIIEEKYITNQNVKWRIRKLMPVECWKLMAFTKEDHDRAAKYTSASARYKMAGNSIIVSCLVAIFSSLFIEDGYKAEVWTKYMLNYND